MRKSVFLAISLAACLSLTDARAETPQERFVRQLTDQGFTEISVTRTWLGRVRIRAASQSHKREIVFNARSGEILRDFSEAGSGGLSDGTSALIDTGSGGTTGGATGGGSGDGATGGGSGGGSGGGGESRSQSFNYLTGGQAEDIDFV